MGYTHYWEINGNSKIKDLSGCLENIKKVIDEHKDIIQKENPSRLDIQNKNLIEFNGIGGDGHETFYFEFPPKKENNQLINPPTLSSDDFESDIKQNFIFHFCKTARKPYDVVVVKCLLILKAYLKGDMKLSSDGEFSNMEEWGQSIKDVQKMGVDIIPHIIVDEL